MPAARFRPPAVTPPPEWRSVLRLAFGPADAAAAPGDEHEALRAALALDLAARLVDRRGVQALAAALGRGAALSLFGAQARVAASGRALLDLARDLAGVGVPMALLKGVALFAAGVARPQARPARDLDLLVPASRAAELAAALHARAFRAADVPERPHQLAPFVDAAGRVVEIHRHLPFVRAPASRATFEALREARALVPLDAWPGAVTLPARDVLAAHALAHGLAQSAFSPQSYCLTRLVGDALDLGLADDDDLAGRAQGWLDSGLASDVAAFRALSRRLAAGDEALFDECVAPKRSPEATLLAHVVAGARDESYRARLRARAALGSGGLITRGRAALDALRLSDAQVDALYGRPRWRWGYVWRRLVRPFDLARRLLRAFSLH